MHKANSGEEALKLFEKRIELAKRGEIDMYKIIFLDYSMPIMDGP